MDELGVSFVHSPARRRSSRGAVVLVAVCAVCVQVSVLGAGAAQAKEKNLRWRWDLLLDEELIYDSNVFRLSDKVRDRLEDERPGDKISGRFDDMDSEDDLVLSSSLIMVSKLSGFGDSRFRIVPSVTYDYFTQNDRMSHPTFGLSFERDSGSSEMSVDFEYELDAFAKNYLHDVTDLTGRVTAKDRVYDRGEYDEFSAVFAYETRLWKRPKKTRSFLDARRIDGFAELGYARRSYDGPFYNRDRNAVGIALGATAQFGKRWKLDLEYDFDFVSTDNGKEVLVRDEPDFDVDFNGDGDTTDLRRRTVQRVDRSRMDHIVDFRLRYDLAKRWEVWAGYLFRYQKYFSDERFDTHRDRDDFGHSVRAGVGWDLDSRWSFELEGKWFTEDANKKEFGDIDDRGNHYERFIVSFGVVLKLF